MSNSDPAITQAEIRAMDASEKSAKRTKPFIDAATLQAYNEYLADWRWNMATHRHLQREYMGGRGYVSGMAGEHY